MCRKSNRPVLLLAFLFAAFVSSGAFAGIIVTLESITPFGADYDWQYSATISPTDGLFGDGNTYFTIYDLPGSIVTVESASDWQASSHLTGVTPTGLLPTDDATKSNVTFKVGIFVNYPGSHTPYIFPFVIRLDTNIAEFSQYAWQDYASYPNVDPETQERAALQNGLGIVRGGSVPTPATVALFGIGLAGLGWSRRRKV